MRYHSRRTIAVLHTRSYHRDSQQEPQRVYEQVPLAAFDFFARIVAALATLRRDTSGLRIQYCGTGLGMPAQPPTLLLAQPILAWPRTLLAQPSG